MMIYPAIDLLDGQAVRLRQGDYQDSTSYGDPLAIARRYAQDGATHLHVVDLDAARSGITSEATKEIVRAILQETALHVQVGGGIRTADDVAAWLALGVQRCILGTAAARDPMFAKRMVVQFGTGVVVGIDARAGVVATQGWVTQETGLTAIAFAQQLAEYGYTECIHTDIARDGMLSGANIAASIDLAVASGLSVIVSGGVKDLQDVQAVREGAARGLSGMIAGKSLYEGTLSLPEALRVAAAGGECG